MKKQVLTVVALLALSGSLSYAEYRGDRDYDDRGGYHNRSDRDYDDRGMYHKGEGHRGSRNYDDRGSCCDGDSYDNRGRHGYGRGNRSHRGNGNRRGNGNHRGYGVSYSQLPVEYQNQINKIQNDYDMATLKISQKYEVQQQKFYTDQIALEQGIQGRYDMYNSSTITPEQAQILLQIDKVQAQAQEINQSEREELRTLKNSTRDAIQKVETEWLKSIAQ